MVPKKNGKFPLLVDKRLTPLPFFHIGNINIIHIKEFFPYPPKVDNLPFLLSYPYEIKEEIKYLHYIDPHLSTNKRSSNLKWASV